MSRWFRAYEDALNDPKIQRLPGERFKVWFNLLCVASANKGTLPPLCDLAFSLRLPEDILRGHIGALQADGLIDTDPETLAMSPHNWSGRQFQSDGSSTERVKRFRNAQRNGNETAPETEQSTDTETDIINPDGLIADTDVSAASTRLERNRQKVAEVRSRIRIIGQDWNVLAADYNLPQILGIDPGDDRERRMMVLLRDGFSFPDLFTKIRESPFLRGERGSTPCSFDWIQKPKNLRKIMEGNYDDEVRKVVTASRPIYASHKFG